MRAVSLKKAPSPIVVTELVGVNETEVRAVSLAKAALPIDVTEFPIVTEAKSLSP